MKKVIEAAEGIPYQGEAGRNGCRGFKAGFEGLRQKAVELKTNLLKSGIAVDAQLLTSNEKSLPFPN